MRVNDQIAVEKFSRYLAPPERGDLVVFLTTPDNAYGGGTARTEIMRSAAFADIDTTGFEHAALMVFNRALPAEPGQCSSTGYALDIEAGSGRMPAPAYSFSAEHFEMPG